MLDLSGPFASPFGASPFGERHGKAAAVENRGQKRTNGPFPGMLVYGGGDIVLSCAICDCSATGARVRLPPGLVTDAELHLIHPRDGAAYWARVVWRFGNRMGLEFLDRLDLTRQGPADIELEAMRSLWLAGEAGANTLAA